MLALILSETELDSSIAFECELLASSLSEINLSSLSDNALDAAAELEADVESDWEVDKEIDSFSFV